MKNKKIISLLLALMMMLSVVPFYASAAEPITLTEANVTVWPTASGEIYFGQKLSDGITLSGGEVQYDGVVVAGHFEFIDPNYLNTKYSSQNLSDIKFVPDDNSTYIGFEILESFDVLYNMNKTTPIFVDENDTIPVATEVEPGAKLSTSKLSGAQVMNPYYPDESKALAGVWKWAKSTTVVNESGYYEARITISGYERISAWVLVRIKGDTSEVKMATSIEELPTPVADAITVGDDISSITLTGGKAVGMNGEEVSGTFSFDGTGKLATAGTHPLSITFTPDDERYATSTAIVSITVEKGNFAFLDENGAETVPEITVPYGATMGDVQSALKGLTMNTTENISFNFADGVKNTDKAATGTYNVIVRSYEDNSSYNETTLPVKVTVEQKELTLYGAYSAETKVLVFSTKEGIAPRGTFDVYVDNALVKSGVAYGEKVAYDAFVASGVHTIKIVYIPKENDGYKIADFEIETQINLARNITAGENTGSISAKINGQNGHIGGESLIVCGDTIELSTIGGEAFLGWKIVDKNGNIANLGIADLKASAITFTMPDYDIVVTAEYEKQENNNDTNGGFDIDSIFGGLDMDELSQGDSEWAIINIIRNIIAKFKSFLQQLIETFQSIGD